MNKNVIMVKIFGGGVLLKADFHPPPACEKDVGKPLSKQKGE
jgi:hypothetical protein